MLGTVKGTEVLCVLNSVKPHLTRRTHCSWPRRGSNLKRVPQFLTVQGRQACGICTGSILDTLSFVSHGSPAIADQPDSGFSPAQLLWRDHPIHLEAERRRLRIPQHSFHWHLLTLRAKPCWKMGQRKVMVSQGNVKIRQDVTTTIRGIKITVSLVSPEFTFYQGMKELCGGQLEL